jgi:hypothetical protein
MIAFLDRWFEFTTSRSLDECEQFIGSIPKLKRVRTPGVYRVESRKKRDEAYYKLCQITGRKPIYYAEASLQMLSDASSQVVVRGCGSVHLFSLAFYLYFIIMGIVLTIILRHILIVAILGVIVLFAANSLFRSFQNRNQLIEYLYENLA